MLAATAVSAPAVAASGAAFAQEFPTRPINIIIPFAPGGGTDVVARAMSAAFGAKLGQPVVVENVSGAAGSIAATRVARAKPDGYTLVMHNVAFALNPSLYSNLPYNTEKDFEPITMINATPLVYVGRKDLPVNSIPELVDWMKKNNAKLAHPGVGSTGHISVAMLAQTIGVQASSIPYRGGGPMLQDIIGGHVDIGTVTLGNAVEPVRSGQVKGLGVSSPQPAKLLPEVPSLVKELGPNVDISFWNALLAPAGTPKAVVDRIHAAFEETVKDKELVDRWEKMGIDLFPPDQRTPDATGKFLRNETASWKKRIEAAGIEAKTL
jgi:tripartite-type tricarboxylate transporter receptor subunit TctC